MELMSKAIPPQNPITGVSIFVGIGDGGSMQHHAHERDERGEDELLNFLEKEFETSS